MANEKWSAQEVITEWNDTTKLCLITGAVPTNKIINPSNLGFATKADPEFTGNMSINGTEIMLTLTSELNDSASIELYNGVTPVLEIKANGYYNESQINSNYKLMINAPDIYISPQNGYTTMNGKIVMTGSTSVIAPTVTGTTDNTAKVATTAFVQAQKNNPVFSGTTSGIRLNIRKINTSSGTGNATLGVSDDIFILNHDSESGYGDGSITLPNPITFKGKCYTIKSIGIDGVAQVSAGIYTVNGLTEYNMVRDVPNTFVADGVSDWIIIN